MREINFRAWEKNLKEMIPVNSIDFDSRMINTNGPWRNFGEIELMQYTGKSDRHGKNIYESDVVKTVSGKLCVIKYIGTAFYPMERKHGGYKQITNWHGCEHGEVIGNVYENSELLEV